MNKLLDFKRFSGVLQSVQMSKYFNTIWKKTIDYFNNPSKWIWKFTLKPFCCPSWAVGVYIMGIKAALPKYELYFYNTVLCLAMFWAASWIFEVSSCESTSGPSPTHPKTHTHSGSFNLVSQRLSINPEMDFFVCLFLSINTFTICDFLTLPRSHVVNVPIAFRSDKNALALTLICNFSYSCLCVP